MIRAGAALAAAAILCGAPAFGAPTKAVTVQRVDVTRLPVVDVYLTVTDDKGHSVLGLTELEVAVGLDTIPQTITSLTSALAGGESLAVALLFDRSGSMKTALDGTKDAAVRFIRRMSVADRMAVISFDDKVRVDAPLTSDHAELETAVNGIATGLDTALYDAIRTALDLLKDVDTKRQAILVLSDGKDTKSVLKADDVLLEAKTRGVPIYTLGLGKGVNAGVLDRLAAETGGSAIKAAGAGELRQMYQTIADQLQNQYILSFTSTFGADEAWHALTVEVRHDDSAAVSARREFIASTGPGVSRELVESYERQTEQRDIVQQAGLWAGVGLIAGVLIVLSIRAMRPDVSLLSLLTVGIILLTSLLGGIVAIVVRNVRF